MAPARGNAVLARCSGMDIDRSILMQLNFCSWATRSLLAVKTVVVTHEEKIVNWLAVLMLLAVGVVWSPV